MSDLIYAGYFRFCDNIFVQHSTVRQRVLGAIFYFIKYIIDSPLALFPGVLAE